MTGTALTEEQEFRDIYGMDVIEIPTNRPVARIDQEDAGIHDKEGEIPCSCRGSKRSACKTTACTGRYNYY